jgi:hypothetical protein
MGRLEVTLPNGTRIGFEQLLALARLREEHGVENTHWHLNDCKCCLTLHGPPGSWLIGSEGGIDFFPGIHCGCAHDVTGQTDVEEH